MGNKKGKRKQLPVQNPIPIVPQPPITPPKRPIAERRWYIVFTIVIAVLATFGGYSGIINLFKKKRPGFDYYCDGILTGNMITVNKEVFTYILLSGVVMNDGDAHLYPKEFTMIGKLRNHIDTFSKFFITPKMYGLSGDSITKQYYDRPDLRLIRALPSNMSARYSIAAVSSINVDTLKKRIDAGMVIYLTCIDYRDKKYTTHFKTPYPGAFTYPINTP
jgi:hypothetical protein